MEVMEIVPMEPQVGHGVDETHSDAKRNGNARVVISEASGIITDIADASTRCPMRLMPVSCRLRLTRSLERSPLPGS